MGTNALSEKSKSSYSVVGVDAGDMAPKEDQALVLRNFCANREDSAAKGQMLP